MECAHIMSNVKTVWPRKKKGNRNLASFTWARERSPIIDEVVWYRPEDIASLDLPKPVVLVTGAFDLMHSPHMRLLFTAREKAGHTGTVLVAMNSDKSVSERKGPSRPILSYVERAAALNYMPIDILVEFDTEDELRMLAVDAGVSLQICGPEYFNKPTTADVPVLCIRDGGPHTSDIIDRVKGRK